MKSGWKKFPALVLPAVMLMTPQLAAPQHADPPDPPRFSTQRGFYEEPFSLIIDTKEENGTIRYTMDGSDPRTSVTAKTGPDDTRIIIDPADTTGRGWAPGFIVRAAVFTPDTFSTVATHTYLFLGQVGQLSPDGIRPGPGWPEPGRMGQFMDYGMDPEVLNDPRYKDEMTEALLSIPSISIATDLKNLFDRKTGIYLNAMERGKQWERPASVELLRPDGIEGFQIDAGLRIRGGYSRHSGYPKHGFRLFFREEYGAAKLQYPLFENEGVAEFDKIDLRACQNYAWSNFGFQGVFNIMIRDNFSRDTQRDMGSPYTRSRPYHLFVDGVYWGLFQTQERPEARFAVSYFGGSVEDYDVVKMAADEGNVIEATDGNLEAWRRIWDLCQEGFDDTENYCTLLGLRPDGTRDPALPRLVDVENLIDYMLIIFQTGNFDTPVSKFGQNKNPNNFYAIYNRNNPDGFIFFAHDCEHTLFTSPYASPGIGLYEDRVNIGDLTDYYRMVVNDFQKFHPQWLHYRLTQNPDYRMRFADRTYKFFFDNGALTPGPNINRFMARAEEIDRAIIAESARWGDAQVAAPRTKHDDWLPQIDNVVDNFFPYRNPIVLDQLRQAGLFNDIVPPRFLHDGQEITVERTVEPGTALRAENSNASGMVYLTTDGSDPRLMDGSVSPSALAIADTDSVVIRSTTRIKGRVLDGGSWSPLHEITLPVRDNLAGLKITEIHYCPLDEGDIDGRELEFIELKNTGNMLLNLTGARFVRGIGYTFPAVTLLDTGAFLVLASNRSHFNYRYGIYPYGEYAGQLDNGGEWLALVNAAGDTLIQFRYNDRNPWPE